MSLIKKQVIASANTLRTEKSENCSGVVLNERSIPILREKDYTIKAVELDGDAPKQFIKAYFYEEGSPIRKSSRQSWRHYIAKTAEKWYPIESVIEYMINRIGEELSLNMNGIKLVRANGQIRFLSQYFIKKDERLIHGAEICGEHLGDMEFAREIANNKDNSRELFTFQFISSAIRSVFPTCCEDILCNLVRMICFDAIVGNNDRHFYNWGIIGNVINSKNMPKFAPLYDSARGLLWNFSDENIINTLKVHKQGGKKIVTYLNKASPRISIDNNKAVNHFDLIDFIKKQKEEYDRIVQHLSSIENEQKILKMLNKEFYHLFIPERAELITLVIRTRFRMIRDL